MRRSNRYSRPLEAIWEHMEMGCGRLIYAFKSLEALDKKKGGIYMEM